MLKFKRSRSQVQKHVDQLADCTEKLSLQQTSPDNILRRSQRGRVGKVKSANSLWSLKSVVKLALPSSTLQLNPSTPTGKKSNHEHSHFKEAQKYMDSPESVLVSPNGDEFTPGNMSRCRSLRLDMEMRCRQNPKKLDYPEYATIATTGRQKAENMQQAPTKSNTFAPGMGLQGWKCYDLTNENICGDIQSGSVIQIESIGTSQTVVPAKVTNVAVVPKSIAAPSRLANQPIKDRLVNAGHTPRYKDKVQHFSCLRPGSSKTLPSQKVMITRTSQRKTKGRRRRRKSKGLLCGIEKTSDSPINSPLRRSPRIAMQPQKMNHSSVSGKCPEFSFFTKPLEISTTSMLGAVLATMDRKSKECDILQQLSLSESHEGNAARINNDVISEDEIKVKKLHTPTATPLSTSIIDHEIFDICSEINIDHVPKHSDLTKQEICSKEFDDIVDLSLDNNITTPLSRKSSLRRSKSLNLNCNTSKETQMWEFVEKTGRRGSFRKALASDFSENLSMDSGVILDDGENNLSKTCSESSHMDQSFTPRRSARLLVNSRSPLTSINNVTVNKNMDIKKKFNTVNVQDALDKRSAKAKSMVNLQGEAIKQEPITSVSFSKVENQAPNEEGDFKLFKRKRQRSVIFSENPVEVIPNNSKATLKRRVSNAALSLKNASLKKSKSATVLEKNEHFIKDAGRTPRPQRQPQSPFQERLIM